MAALTLTSYERLRRYVATAGDEAMTASTALRFQLTQWAQAVSANIEKHLNRELKIESRIDYWDTRGHIVEYPVKAPPIVSITSMEEDSTAQWTSPSALSATEYTTNVGDKAVLLETPRPGFRKSLRATYLGGLAYHGTRSTLTATAAGGSFTAGKFAQGNTSGAMGIVVSATAADVVVEVLRAGFETGETITEYDDEDCATASGVTAPVTARPFVALVESHPDIVAAAEIECRYMWKHKDSFETTNDSRDGTSGRRTVDSNKMLLTKEAANYLIPYRRHHIVP